MKPRAYKNVDILRVAFGERKTAIRKRLAEFKAVSANDYFYELVYCLLTPQSSAINAGRAVDAMKRVDVLNSGVDVTGILFNKQHYIRFHNTKAQRVAEVRSSYPTIFARLMNGSTSVELRAWLANNVKGLGYKEASHFLRNIGHRDLAILDRHILKNLLKHRVIHSIPRSLTENRYLTIEKKFQQFADDIAITLDELDLLFWSTETGEILK
ncbi:MAG: N-glycosylase/DNA lyase [Ignavibacteriae bacterium]|nr:N-glycosylase/DNA lyase [Ignavibacteriota bacterium]